MVTKKYKDAIHGKEQNGIELLKTMNTSLKNVTDVEEKKEGEEKLKMILGTYKKYVAAYGDSVTPDNTVFLKMAKVFQAEYDSRVTYPKQLAILDVEKDKLKQAHQFKIQQEVQKRQDRLSVKLDNVEHDSDKKRKGKKRDFTELDDELLSWAGDAPLMGSKKKK